MDNFIDKLAQKFTAGEVIRANQAAEERELKRLQIQVAEYEKCLQEMRKLQLRNTETAEGLKQLVSEGRQAVEAMAEESRQAILAMAEENRQAAKKLAEESLEKISAHREESGAGKIEEETARLLGVMEENQKKIGEWFRQADDFLHKENVKVYRNVQAVLVEESKNRSEAILAGQEATAKKYYKKMIWIMLITLLAAVSGVVIQVMKLYELF